MVNAQTIIFKIRAQLLHRPQSYNSTVDHLSSFIEAAKEYLKVVPHVFFLLGIPFLF